MDIKVKAVIPAAGLGTRLLPATRAQPKEMLPVGRKPVIQYVIEELKNAGIDNTLIITGQHKRAIEDHFDRSIPLTDINHRKGMDLRNAPFDVSGYEEREMRLFYVRQPVQTGLAGAIALAQPFVDDDNFIVALGDVIYRTGSGEDSLVNRLLKTHLEREAAATIALQPVPRELVQRYGIVRARDTEGPVVELVDLVEKPRAEEAPSNLAIASRYVLSPRIFEAIQEIKPGVGGELQLTDALKLLLQEGLPVYGVLLEPGEKRFDIGSHDSYFKAFIELALSDEELGAGLCSFTKGLLERLEGQG